MSLAATPYLDAVWAWSSSGAAYTDNTNESRSQTGTAFTVFSAAADYLYLGSEEKFDLLVFILSTNGSLGDLTWQYYDGATWKILIPASDSIEGNEDYTSYGFSEDGAELFFNLQGWASFILTTTVPHTVSSVPDSLSRYWIRVKAASVTTAPSIKNIQKRSYDAYCTPQQVYSFLQLNFTEGAFTSSTKPSLSTVEDIIHRRQGYIDRMTRKSWRPNIAIDHQPFNLGGISLSKKSAYRPLKLEIWNGGSWENKTIGRDHDWFFIPRINTINFSRLFLLPARFTGANRGYYGFGIGEFDHGIRIKYLYGKNRFIDDEEGSVVKDICIKLTCADLLENADYSKLIVSGTDRVLVTQRIAGWKEEALSTMESLRPFETF